MKANQSSYGIITLHAVELIRQQLSPIEAWHRAVAGKEKGCPKSAFLGLCQFGWVKDVPRGEYLSSRALNGPNKDYTIRAAQLLLADSEAVYTPRQLWTLSIADLNQPPANHNQQMNVALALSKRRDYLLKEWCLNRYMPKQTGYLPETPRLSCIHYAGDKGMSICINTLGFAVHCTP
ncbi:DUF6979 family protein [Buttiauxella massiliensis]|uniref:DUF6979 family protein n=1 Tax=Buttiauxella massiliensis TaxID=2831590 RepID=UPI00125EB239|nr:hypothetical protein [Buttiauxella massiliensis]